MQWSDETNGGFSKAPANRLAAPAIADGAFSYRTVNVARQLDDPDSLLSKVRTFVSLRRAQTAIGSAACRIENTGEAAVLGHSYRSGQTNLILLHNLCGKRRKAQLDLGQAEGGRLRDLLIREDQRPEGRTMTIELEPYGYRWLLATPD
jgi:maltose alpha-D-glucosyltransferase/alpha-amylase